MREIFEGVIRSGNYRLEALEQRIKTLFARGDLSEQDMDELLSMAALHARDEAQIDVAAAIADLTRRGEALESKGVTVWTPTAKLTAKGQTRLYDVDGDGVLDYCRYDGGRASTSLSPGKIDGWVKTDADGNVTHRITKDEAGKIVLVPVEEETSHDGN